MSLCGVCVQVCGDQQPGTLTQAIFFEPGTCTCTIWRGYFEGETVKFQPQENILWGSFWRKAPILNYDTPT